MRPLRPKGCCCCSGAADHCQTQTCSRVADHSQTQTCSWAADHSQTQTCSGVADHCQTQTCSRSCRCRLRSTQTNPLVYQHEGVLRQASISTRTPVSGPARRPLFSLSMPVVAWLPALVLLRLIAPPHYSFQQLARRVLHAARGPLRAHASRKVWGEGGGSCSWPTCQGRG
eukprot:20889-Chlamydomonas_euryale.AAC.4